MADMPDRLRELLELYDMLDRHEKIQQLISVADRFREVPEEIAVRPFGDAHKVPACESEAFVWAERRADGTLKFHFAVENPQGISARALAVLLDDTLSGAPLEEVAAVTSDLIYRVFGRELSMGKSMGLMGMVTMVQTSAKRALAATGD